MNQYFWVTFSQENLILAKSHSLKSEYGFISLYEAKKDAHIRCQTHKAILINQFDKEYEVIDLCGVV